MIGNQPVVVAYGVGRDSTAMLVEMYNRGIRPDAITFANVGSEKQQTYDFIPIMRRWLRKVSFPDITVVQYEPKIAPYFSIEGNMILNATLPGAAFQIGSCTQKAKIAPQNKWSDTWEQGQRAFAQGHKIVKFVGFECDEIHRLKRADAKMHAGKGDKKYAQRFSVFYPLMEWGYDLEKCMEIIDAAGLPIPVKSACFFCPNQQMWEVAELSDDDRARIILMELVAGPYNVKMRGLWRKGTRNKPGSITEYILQQKLTFTPLEQLCDKVVLNPKCKKAREGFTMDPPHVGVNLADILCEHGFFVPAVIRPGEEAGDIRRAYKEDYRRVPLTVLPDEEPEESCGGCEMTAEVEDEVHGELVEAL